MPSVPRDKLEVKLSSSGVFLLARIYKKKLEMWQWALNPELDEALQFLQSLRSVLHAFNKDIAKAEDIIAEMFCLTIESRLHYYLAFVFGTLVVCASLVSKLCFVIVQQFRSALRNFCSCMFQLSQLIMYM